MMKTLLALALLMAACAGPRPIEPVHSPLITTLGIATLECGKWPQLPRDECLRRVMP
jgi:hypothetical protein